MRSGQRFWRPGDAAFAAHGNSAKEGRVGVPNGASQGYARPMQATRTFLGACALIVGMAGPAFGQTAGSAQQFLELWGKAWDTHDVDAIVRLHADDCVTVNRFGVVASGRDEIRRAAVWLHNGPFRNAHFTAPKLIDQRKLAPGVITLQAAWRNPSGKADPPEDDLVLTVVLKDYGAEGWLAEEIDTHTVEPLAPAVITGTPSPTGRM